MTPIAPFPAGRLRRTRMHAWSRDLVAEVALTPERLILPLFVTDGARERLASLPFVECVPLAELGAEVAAAAALGTRAVALFPHGEQRGESAARATDPGNLMCRAIAAAKASAPDIGVIADVALDPYTANGQDGLLAADGTVDNDATLPLLAEQAVVQARAGADIVAPSDMMDGRVGAIRAALEAAGLKTTQIMAYSAKYASCLYGPFREGVGSGAHLKGDKRNYQMDPRGRREALR
ncbi:MAG: porphobilinogen synthase, partial [Sphingomonadaceae bacterium]